MVKILAIDRSTQEIAEVSTEKISNIDLSSDEKIHIFDFFSPSDEEIKLLSDFFKFHPLAIEDCVNEVHYPKIDDYEEYIYLVIYCRTSQQGSSVKSATPTKDFCEVDIFLSKNYLLIYRYEHTASVEKFFDRLKKSTPLRGDKTTGLILYDFLKECIEQYFTHLEILEKEVERVEEMVFKEIVDKSTDPTEQIQNLRQKLVQMHSAISPQREVFNKLSRDEFKIITKSVRNYFRDIYDHLYRITETLTAYREFTANLMDTHLVNISNRMNNIMKTLTIISTVILPLSFIASVYGMNFKYMPELQWQYGYYAVLFVMFIVAFLMIFILKSKKWL